MECDSVHSSARESEQPHNLEANMHSEKGTTMNTCVTITYTCT